jgi:hypothetical protein
MLKNFAITVDKHVISATVPAVDPPSPLPGEWLHFTNLENIEMTSKFSFSDRLMWIVGVAVNANIDPEPGESEVTTLQFQGSNWPAMTVVEKLFAGPGKALARAA